MKRNMSWMALGVFIGVLSMCLLKRQDEEIIDEIVDTEDDLADFDWEDE